MEEKLEEKKEWITPEIIDLDVEKTGKPTEFGSEISPSSGPS